MPNQITVPFHGSNLFIVEHQNQPFTPMKPIVEGMGLDWRGQQAKLAANPRRWGMEKISIPSIGGKQATVCIPLRKLFGWLQTLSPNKVKQEIRNQVIQYQNECDDVLWDYWNQQCNKPAAPVMPPQTMRLLMVMDQGRVVSTQVVPDDCMVLGRSEIPELIKEPGFFSVEDLKRIADIAMARITEVAQSNIQAIKQR
ncbi:phage antirepressor N-terminal domain-containing protein [Photobacterium atrarenae]|uniref:Phage antirepressor N-terminal domain-containing protein n=1 Tax=Photobacterium atrarenae TaxID=865757 RepID=A0ABY5GB30_9GAMM|nr:phage antirepressor N-terminal domain-containing protein [Photobacterium atrarenae]UTV26370.1 phage antirepressor N-terminal domain-containing protein [Photobacterium atrarenae]